MIESTIDWEKLHHNEIMFVQNATFFIIHETNIFIKTVAGSGEIKCNFMEQSYYF